MFESVRRAFGFIHAYLRAFATLPVILLGHGKEAVVLTRRLEGGQVYVARMADCWTVLRDPHTFANGNGFKAVEMPDEERMLGEMDPPRHPVMRRIMRSAFDKHAVEAARPFAREQAARLLELGYIW